MPKEPFLFSYVQAFPHPLGRRSKTIDHWPPVLLTTLRKPNLITYRRDETPGRKGQIIRPFCRPCRLKAVYGRKQSAAGEHVDPALKTAGFKSYDLIDGRQSGADQQHRFQVRDPVQCLRRPSVAGIVPGRQLPERQWIKRRKITNRQDHPSGTVLRRIRQSQAIRFVLSLNPYHFPRDAAQCWRIGFA